MDIHSQSAGEQDEAISAVCVRVSALSLCDQCSWSKTYTWFMCALYACALWEYTFNLVGRGDMGQQQPHISLAFGSHMIDFPLVGL